MRRLILILALMFMVTPVAFAWLETDAPEGHIESAGNNADGDVIPYTALTITSIIGTAHKGGDNQAAADAKGVVYSIYIGWDRTRASGIDAVDEPPNANTTLSAGIDNAVTTLPVVDTSFFYNEGAVLIGTELIAYTGKTATTITGCTRGYNETSAAAHLTAAVVTARAGFDLVTTIVCDGSPYHAIGFDATTTTADDGTEGELLQDGTTITLTKARSYVIKLRVVDGAGNTNTEVAAADVFFSYSASCYVDEDGDVAQGLEDDEVWKFTTARRPAIALLRRRVKR